VFASRTDVERWHTLIDAYATLGPAEAAKAAAVQQEIRDQTDASLRRNHQLAAGGDTSIRPGNEIVIVERVAEQLLGLLDDLAAGTTLPDLAVAARAAAQLVHLASTVT